MKTLQCQGYVNINDLTSRTPLSLWHYNCPSLLKSDLQNSFMRFYNATIALQRRIRMILLFVFSLHLTCIRFTCEFSVICNFFLHLWIFFIGESFSFIRRHFVIHPLLKWISTIKRTSSLKFNFSFFFLQRWRVFNRLKMKNISKEAWLLKRGFFRQKHVYWKKSDDFFRELKTLIFSLHMNGSSFIDDIYCALMKRRMSDVDAIVLRYQIS